MQAVQPAWNIFLNFRMTDTAPYSMPGSSQDAPMFVRITIPEGLENMLESLSKEQFIYFHIITKVQNFNYPCNSIIFKVIVKSSPKTPLKHKKLRYFMYMLVEIRS